MGRKIVEFLKKTIGFQEQSLAGWLSEALADWLTGFLSDWLADRLARLTGSLAGRPDCLRGLAALAAEPSVRVNPVT